MFFWGSYLETGHPAVDSQHKKLFLIVSELSGTIRGDGPPPNLAEIFSDLTSYAETHFRFEEELFAESGLSPEAMSRHSQEHAAFVERLRAVIGSPALRSTRDVSNILNMLMHWLVQHVLSFDHELARSLRKSSGKPDPVEELSVESFLISALMESERRFRDLANAFNVLIWVGTEDERFFVNDAWRELCGLSGGDPSAPTWQDVVHPDDQARYRAALAEARARLTSTAVEYRVVDVDGVWRWVRETVTPRLVAGRVVGLSGSAFSMWHVMTFDALLQTIEQRIADEVSSQTKHLLELSSRDALTGLFNRRFLDRYLNERCRLLTETRVPLALAFIDIDDFKQINDSFGHDAGDAVLRYTAGRIGEMVRRTDIAARFGGDEFCVVLEGCDVGQAALIAEKLRSAVAGRKARPDIPVCVSIGVAVLGPGENCASLLHRADQALLLAKRDGKNCMRVG